MKSLILSTISKVTQTLLYGYSFFPHAVKLWATLPASIALSLMTPTTSMQGVVFVKLELVAEGDKFE